MQTLITVIHFVASFVLIVAVLLQSGKGGGMGAAFGGASSQIFGGRGAGNFLTRVTAPAAIMFFVTSLVLSLMSSRQHSVVEQKLKGPPAAAQTTDAVNVEQNADAPAAESDASPQAPAEPAPAAPEQP